MRRNKEDEGGGDSEFEDIENDKSSFGLLDAFSDFSEDDKEDPIEEDIEPKIKDDEENLEMDDAIDIDLLLDQKEDPLPKAEIKKEEEIDDDLPEMSDTSKRHFQELKSKKEDWKKRALEAEEKSSIKVEDTQEYKDIKTQLTELKEIVSVEHFERDPDFVNQFTQPVIDSTERVKKWASSADKEDLGRVQDLLSTMAPLVGNLSDENKFFVLADKVEDLIEGSSSKRRFGKAVSDWFDAAKSRNEALSDRDSTREKLIKSKAESAERNGRRNSIAISAITKDWKEANRGTISFFDQNKETIGFDAEDSLNKSSAKAVELIERLSATGEISPELVSMIVNGGVTGELESKKYDMAMKALQSQSEKNKSLLEELEKKNKQLEKISGKPRGSSSGSSSDNYDEDDDDGDSGLVSTFNSYNRG